MYETSRAAVRTAAAPDVEVSAARRRVSWGAIFAGVVIALAVQLLLGVLGLGIGLGTVDPAQGDTPSAASLGIGAGLWWLVSYLLAAVAGGYAAARLAGSTRPLDGSLHGLVTWGFGLILTFYLLTSAVGGVIGGAFRTIGGAASTLGQTVKDAAPQLAQTAGVTPDAIRERAESLLNAQPPADPRAMSREDATKEIASNLPKLVQGGEAASQARDRITQIMAAQLNISPEEANSRLDQLQSQAQQTASQAVGTAKQAADTTASGLSTASLLAFAALLLGAGAAWFGGYRAARDEAVGPYGRTY
jgi:hypothetical protein